MTFNNTTFGTPFGSSDQPCFQQLFQPVQQPVKQDAVIDAAMILTNQIQGIANILTVDHDQTLRSIGTDKAVHALYAVETLTELLEAVLRHPTTRTAQ